MGASEESAIARLGLQEGQTQVLAPASNISGQPVRSASRNRSQRLQEANMSSLSPSARSHSKLLLRTCSALALVGLLAFSCCSVLADESSSANKSNQENSLAPVRSTQATLDRQVDAPNSSASSGIQAKSEGAQQATASEATPSSASSSASKSTAASAAAAVAAAIRAKQKAAAIAAGNNYDKYQLKATNSFSHQATAASEAAASANSKAVEVARTSTQAPSADEWKQQVSSQSQDSQKSKGSILTQKKTGQSSSASSASSPSGSSGSSSPSSSNGNSASGSGGNSSSNNSKPKSTSSSFSLLRKLLPSFMTSAAGPVAAAAAAAASAAVDKHQSSHSRSSQSGALSADGPFTSKIINLLTSSAKKSVGAVPDHAPFFVRKQSGGIDRQGGFASGLLSNPLSLGLLFSAPLIPSLLLTPLAIAGLSPAMSAINNLFGDDDEPASSQPSTSAPGGILANSPFASMLAGPSSPLSSILQGSSPLSQSSSSGPQSSNLALQAMQSFLGPPASTERPLFNPGMFASQGIQNAIGSSSSSSGSSGSSSSSSGSSSSGGQSSGGPIRSFLGGNSLIQTAASMISPSFAAPPSSGSQSSSGSSGSSSLASSLLGSDSESDADDGPGFMQAASDVFEKVTSYIGSDREVGQATGASSSHHSGHSGHSGAHSSSPLSTLVGLSSFSPFQLSSLFASSPIGTAAASGSSSSSAGSSSAASSSPQRAGFFATLKNVYELFTSSFLRRQEVGDNSNECQQRLICELHQRAMNSKLFRRSIQSNLMELANLDRNLQEQIKQINQQAPSMQARVDADTKTMLNDFLKATNNFKQGRELVNCSKMFSKCSRVMLLAAANAHLTDSTSGKAIGKFTNLMKKMKFKSIQQHQQQWKLRKPNKSNALGATVNVGVGGQAAAIQALPRGAAGYVSQPTDYLQVAPLSAIPAGPNSKQVGQLNAADSLKLVQQIMLMSQQYQQMQQQQQPQQQSQAQSQQPQQQQPQMSQSAQQAQQQQFPAASIGQQMAMQYSGQVQQQQQQQADAMFSSQPSGVYANYAQYQTGAQGAPMSTVYMDAVAPSLYSSTDSPYYIQSPQQMGVNPPALDVSQQNQQTSQMQPLHQKSSMQPQQQSPQQPQQQPQQQSVGQQATGYSQYPKQEQLVSSTDRKVNGQQQQVAMMKASAA